MMEENNLKCRIIIAIVITIILLSTLLYKTAFVNLVNFNTAVTNYKDNLYVNFIDVGQGKAIAIRLDDGKSVLIDCGSTYEKVKFFNYFNDKFITSNTYPYLDYLILTHTDSDHIGNTIELLERYEVKNIFLPPYCKEFLENNSFNTAMGVSLDFVNAVENEQANISYNGISQEILGDNYSFTFLAPLDTTYKNKNDYSAVIKLQYAGKNFLFTGDISDKVERELVEFYKTNPNNLEVDVLDISHHGSKYGSSEEFLLATRPTYAVISVGKNNYGHPHEDVLSRLNSCGVARENIITTLSQGNIIFNINLKSNEISISTLKYAYALKTNYTWWQIFIASEVLLIIFTFAHTKFGVK